MSIIDTLITDRVPGATYGWKDMNRVADAMEYVAERLRGYGFSVTVSPQQFYRSDFPTVSVFEHYIEQLRTLRNTLKLFITTPVVPGVSRERPYMTVQEANDIEKILTDVEAALNIIATTFVPCGEALCGGDYL